MQLRNVRFDIITLYYLEQFIKEKIIIPLEDALPGPSIPNLSLASLHKKKSKMISIFKMSMLKPLKQAELKSMTLPVIK